MQKIKEDFLYYLWKTKQFNTSAIKTIDGQSVEILSFGIQNHHSGPDFSDAKIKIGDTIWAGNVEMHVFSSDWTLHKHQYDDAYKNVILHVVYEHDKEIVFNTESSELIIPTVSLKKYIPNHIVDTYRSLLESESWIPCESIIGSVDSDIFNLWKYNLTIQRLWSKTNNLDDLLTVKGKDWEEVFYILLSRYFGATANTLAFEQLALSCPIKLLYKNKNNPLAIQSLLFGQAGFLNADFEDHYFQNLKQEYKHLKNKYKLSPLLVSTWKFGRMMPPGFPTYRIAQLAAVVLQNDNLFSKIIEVDKVEDLYTYFDVDTDPFWEEHYTFNKPSKSHSSKLTSAFIDRIIINCIVPITFLYGKRSGNEDLVDKAVSFLEHIAPESNKIITKWKTLGYASKSAFDTQSLLHLKKEYCDQINCMQCSIGHKLFSQLPL